MPQRVQRRRMAGKPGMPPGAVYVGRPSRWGNPWTARPGNKNSAAVAAAFFSAWLNFDPTPALGDRASGDMVMRRARILNDLWELRGRDLACWCPLDQPCHADVLLELANAEGAQR
ncbi:hypothetical protein B1R94_26065 [Mycolicibacterium litorale]|nr:hypothetical protein B1R94_26065 [Mycolicibacterium litorale]